MKPLTDIFRSSPAPTTGRSLTLDGDARRRIAQQIAETSGVVTAFGSIMAAPAGEGR